MPHHKILQPITCIDIDGKTYRVAADKLTWRPSAYGIIIKDDHVLLSRQDRGYDLPGGGVEFGESLELAVMREVKEETGVNVDLPKLVGCLTSYFKMPTAEDEFVQALMFYYVCDYRGGMLSIEGFDDWEKLHVNEPEWYPIDKLSDITVASSKDFRPFILKAAQKPENYSGA